MVTETLIAALILVESGGNDAAVGKRGELGCLQINWNAGPSWQQNIEATNFYWTKVQRALREVGA